MRKAGSDIIGDCLNAEVTDPADHVMLCPECLQPIDCRDLTAVFHHNRPGHEPLPLGAAERLLRADQQLRGVLGRPERRQNVRRAN